MSSQSLYRKWRSQTFADLVGQEHITRTLLNALRGERVVHAYLFCGPRGTGKTSTARLLAKAVNCLNNDGHGEPCNECTVCRSITDGRSLDVIEIDAASNRGIDDVRDLREKVNFAPAEARRKFYIIDEVHQLTEPAFNALLKTLEEPPGHTIFVLASTEAHKIPATILSRCQRFDFHRIGVREMADRLGYICEQEGIEAERAALEMVARAATGSLRDAISTLDQLRAYADGALTVAEVEALLGTRGAAPVRELVGFLLQKNLGAGLKLINALADEGVEMRQLCREVVDYLRALLLVKTGAVPPEGLGLTAEAEEAVRQLAQAVALPELVRALQLFSQADFRARGLVLPQMPLELAFAEVVLGTETARPTPAAPAPRPFPTSPPARASREPAVSAPATPPAPRPTPARPEQQRPVAPAAEAQPPSAPPPAAPAAAVAGAVPPERLRDYWNQVVELLGHSDRKVQALLRDSSGPERIEDKTVVLAFGHSFHKEAVEQDKNRTLVEAAFATVLGRPCILRCVLSTRGEQPRPTSALDDPLVREAISRGARIKEVKNSAAGEVPGDKQEPT